MVVIAEKVEVLCGDGGWPGFDSTSMYRAAALFMDRR
jgi:hypothetical protein